MLLDDEFKFYDFEEEAAKTVKQIASGFKGIPFRIFKMREAQLIIQRTEYLAVKKAYISAFSNPESKFIYNEKDNESLMKRVQEVVDRILSLRWEKVDNIICNSTTVCFFALSPNFYEDKHDWYGIYRKGYLTNHKDRKIDIYVAPETIIPENEFLYYYDGIFIKGKLRLKKI